MKPTFWIGALVAIVMALLYFAFSFSFNNPPPKAKRHHHTYQRSYPSVTEKMFSPFSIAGAWPAMLATMPHVS